MTIYAPIGGFDLIAASAAYHDKTVDNIGVYTDLAALEAATIDESTLKNHQDTIIIGSSLYIVVPSAFSGSIAVTGWSTHALLQI